MSLLDTVALAPRDPILGLNEAFAADPRSEKVNLGVGVYKDEQGKLPLMECIRLADQQLVAQAKPYGYLPINGFPPYTEVVPRLVFGESIPMERVAFVQSLGGTGALRVAADFLRQIDASAEVYISDPSWENHEALFSRAGFTVRKYPYYDAATRGINFDGMLETLKAAKPGSIIILHACCHNPTGYDLDPAQWSQVRDVVKQGQLVPLLDAAYQGFANGLVEDGTQMREFAAAGVPLFVANSFSKNLGLYGERVGGLSVVCDSAEQAQRVLSQLKVTVRTNYSNPVSHGAQLVSKTLHDEELRDVWETELNHMRDRIKQMRAQLRSGLEAADPSRDFSYITAQNGMFSYSGLSAEQMIALREDHAVYGLDSGRICIAALNENNLPRVIAAIAAVL